MYQYILLTKEAYEQFDHQSEESEESLFEDADFSSLQEKLDSLVCEPILPRLDNIPSDGFEGLSLTEIANQSFNEYTQVSESGSDEAFIFCSRYPEYCEKIITTIKTIEPKTDIMRLSIKKRYDLLKKIVINDRKAVILYRHHEALDSLEKNQMEFGFLPKNAQYTEEQNTQNNYIAHPFKKDQPAKSLESNIEKQNKDKDNKKLSKKEMLEIMEKNKKEILQKINTPLKVKKGATHDEAIQFLQDETIELSKKTINVFGKKSRSPCLSGIYDLETSMIFFGINIPTGKEGNKQYKEWLKGTPPEGIDPFLHERVLAYQQKIIEGTVQPQKETDLRLAAHSEVRALDKLLKERRARGLLVNDEVLNKLTLHNRDLKHALNSEGIIPDVKDRCLNCENITDGVNTHEHQ